MSGRHLAQPPPSWRQSNSSLLAPGLRWLQSLTRNGYVGAPLSVFAKVLRTGTTRAARAPVSSCGSAPATHDRTVPDDLPQCWLRARAAALHRFAPGSLPELELVKAVSPEDWGQALLAVFDNSLRLGRSCAQFVGGELDLTQLSECLARVAAPCLRQAFEPLPLRASQALRPPCSEGPTVGARYCDYWREALGGLVLGLSDGHVRHTRHRSAARGASACLDQLYTDPESAYRHGPIPEALEAGLAAVSASFARLAGGSTVRFLGLSEQHLCYRIEGDTAAGGALALSAMLERAVRRRFPELELIDSLPRAVFAPGS